VLFLDSLNPFDPSLMSRGRNISLVLISIPSLVGIFNRVKRRVPHVEQELHNLPEHSNFWAIKKLCSFSWTFLKIKGGKAVFIFI
jgi:hypothetical protein